MAGRKAGKEPAHDKDNPGRMAGLTETQNTYEVLVEDGNGHRVVHRVDATSEADARQQVDEALRAPAEPRILDAAAQQ